jgi:hypothetical protein
VGLTPGFIAVAGLLATLVFVRACWAHRHEPGSERLWTLWLVLGGLLIVSWMATTAIELTPDSTLHAPIHVFCIASSFFWLVLTSSWLTGRVTSKLFRRLERGPAATDP